MTEIFQNFDFRGGIIVYFIVWALSPFIRYYIVKKYHDPLLLGLAIIISSVYGLLTGSALKGVEAFAASQVIHALIKKGLLFNKS